MNLRAKTELELAVQERYYIRNYKLSYSELQNTELWLLRLWKKLDDLEKLELNQTLAEVGKPKWENPK